jgi:hypothetical protein
MANITKFITELSTDSSKLEDFKADPHGAMDEAGLTAKEKNAVLSGDPDEIRALLAPGKFPPPNFKIVVTVVIKF